MSPRAWITTALSLALLPSCAEDEAPPPAAIADEPAPTIVEPVWAGCDDYGEGTCVLWRTPSEIRAWERGKYPELRAWVDVVPSASITVTVDGEHVEPTRVASDAGTRLHIKLPSGARTIQIEGPSASGRITLEIVPFSEEIDSAALAVASADSREAGCTALHSVDDSKPWHDRVQAARLLSEHCTPPDDAERLRAAETVAKLASDAGLRKIFVHHASAAAFYKLERLGDLEGARRLIEQIAESAKGLEEAEVVASYYAVLLHQRSGETARAVEPAARAQMWAVRLGMTEFYVPIMEQRAIVLAELGRVAEASEIAAQVLAQSRSEVDACVRARMINNATWTLQLLAEGGGTHEPPYDAMVELLSIYDAGECQLPQGALHARINIARAALETGELDLAEAWLESIDPDDPGLEHQDLRPELVDLRARLAIETSEWKSYPVPLLANAPSSGAPRIMWQEAVRNATLLERFGLNAAAVDEWTRAESIVEGAVRGRLDSSGGSYISGRGESVRGLVEALVRLGRNDEALCRARLARGRALRQGVVSSSLTSVDTRHAFESHAAFLRLRGELMGEAAEDWRFSGDEITRRRARRRERLQALSESFDSLPADVVTDDCLLLRDAAVGELIVLVLPEENDTLVLADDGLTVTAHRRPPIPADEVAREVWAALVLEAITDKVERSRTVRILPVGQAWEVPFHAADWNGAPLIAHAAVAYALDLPVRSRPESTSRAALLVADPSDDLPLAVTEVDSVKALLGASDWDVSSAKGSAVTRAAVLDLLGRVDLFHYAGHGVHRGSEGWDAALLLDGSMPLEVPDVVALPRAPRWVVLTGCETGTVSPALLDGGMSLGRAFLVAGSDGVLVSDRRVSDDTARSIGIGLYENMGARLGFDLVAALAGAQGSVLRTSSTVDWSAFRVLVR